MPIYEYRRKSDGKILEILQKASDAPLEKCPETGEPVEKLISASAFHLKGSGWYTTDYKKSAAPSEKPKEVSSSPATTETSAASPASPSAKPEATKVETSSTD